MKRGENSTVRNSIFLLKQGNFSFNTGVNYELLGKIAKLLSRFNYHRILAKILITSLRVLGYLFGMLSFHVICTVYSKSDQLTLIEVLRLETFSY